MDVTKKIENNKGFTLIEMIIAVSLIAVMSVIILNGLNPKSATDKGHDTQRKNDIRRLGVAMEEYFSDKGCYPAQAIVDAIQCGSSSFKPWVINWPCDPDGSKYYIYTENSSCPKYYKILTDLKNRSDSAIPSGWYHQDGSVRFGNGSLTMNMVNYGISSSNIKWNE